MLPLMEMFAQGANGNMIDAMARQYGLTSEQTAQAVEALMPAFSQGLKRNASDPYGFMNFLNALSSGQHASYYQNPAQAFAAAGTEGNAILGHLFGSKEVSRAVAAQAAQMTGLSQSILKSMLPALAPIILGGLFKQMNGAAAPHHGTQGAATDNPLGPLGQIFGQMAGGGAANPWGKMFEEMTGGKGGQSPSGSGNPWGDILGQMMGGGQHTGGQSQQPSADNPLGRIFEDMLKGGPGMTGSNEHGSAPEDRDQDNPPPGGGFDDLFGEMFETGRKMQSDYQKNVESIFDQFLGGMQKNR